MVDIEHFSSMFNPEFALINSGNGDILVTHIELWMNGKDRTTKTYMPHKLTIYDSGSYLIHAGKAIHCKIELTNELDKEFILGGELSDESDPPLYWREAVITVKWVDSQGKSNEASAVLYKYGYSEDLHIRAIENVNDKIELYNALTNRSN